MLTAMAKGRKTGGRDWKSGTSGNKAGRPALPPELRAVKPISAARVRTIITNLMFMGREEMLKHIQAPTTSVLELLIASVMTHATTEGDEARLGFLLDRSIGKIVSGPTVLQSCTYRTTVGGGGRLWQEMLDEVLDEERDK